MNITLEHPNKTSDYGPSVELTGEIVYLDMPHDAYIYIKTTEGVFRRSTSYWLYSPYGWRRILPNHTNKWGMQDD